MTSISSAWFIFFLYDYKFEDIWTDTEKHVETLKSYRAVLTPDFSMYLELHPVLQLYNTFRNRWVGAYLAAQGIKVVPTVNWGDESTFDFCFSGSAVAVSTYMAQAHSTCAEQKEWFLKGYNAMMQRIETFGRHLLQRAFSRNAGQYCPRRLRPEFVETRRR
ncbi:MAG: DUF4417 domain-containing protein [Oscillospiraceae bacterium]|nr:DUF4417 domain-containing protein [Oscillospiraceae bacterium]